jgi:hypothetical protein
MNLRAQTAPGAANRLRVPILFLEGTVLMQTTDAAIDHQIFQIRARILNIRFRLRQE